MKDLAAKKIRRQARALQAETVENRRWLHAHAEVGFELTQTKNFVKEKLREAGIVAEDCSRAGVVAAIGGKKSGAFLLRADMDALPIAEKTDLPFACKTGNMHACGHDMHTAILLSAAKILKANEEKLPCAVKLLFQPAEEILEGAKDAIEAGALEKPSVKGAAMLHVMTGVPLPAGTLVVPAGGVGAPAADYFTVEALGKGCHGSSPQNGVDALNVAAHILIALQEIPARELSALSPAVLTVGKMQGGDAGNAIADRAILEGTLRAFDEGVREQVKTRLQEIAEGVAKTFRAKANVRFGGGCPTLLNDGKLSEFALKSLRELAGEKRVLSAAELGGGVTGRSGGSEDFAYISRKVPSVMLALGAGEREKGFVYPLHHPKAVFDESALEAGVAAMAFLAISWKG